MEDTLMALFCLVDDFCKIFSAQMESVSDSNGLKKRHRRSQLSPSEMMTKTSRYYFFIHCYY